MWKLPTMSSDSPQWVENTGEKVVAIQLMSCNGPVPMSLVLFSSGLILLFLEDKLMLASAGRENVSIGKKMKGKMDIIG